MAGALGAQISAGAAFVKIFTDNRQFKHGLAQARKDLMAFKTFASNPIQAVAANPGAFAQTAVATITKLENKVRSLSGTLQSTASTLLTLGATMGMPLYQGLKTFGKFDSQMRLIERITGSTTNKMNKLRDAANRVNEARPATLGDVSSGMLSLARMGLNADEIEKSILPVVNLDIATGANNLGSSARIAAAAMQTFNLPAEDMARITDILTAGANGSAQELIDLGEALTYAGNAGAMAKEDLAEIVAMTGVLANLGIKGSMAGTAIRNALVRIASPKQQELLRNLGVETINPMSGDLRPMADIMFDYYKATRTMSNSQQITLSNEIFGVRGMLGGIGLSRSPEDLEKMINTVRNANGLANETADYMMQGPLGKFQQLLGTLETGLNKLGEAVAPIANKYMEDIIKKVKYLTEIWIPANHDTIESYTKLVANILKLGVVLAGAALAAKGLTLALMVGKTVVPIIANMGTAITMLIAKMKGLKVATESTAEATAELKAAMGGWAAIAGLLAWGAYEGISYLINRDKEAAKKAYTEILELQSKSNKNLSKTAEASEKLTGSYRKLMKIVADTKNYIGMDKKATVEKLITEIQSAARDMGVKIPVSLEFNGKSGWVDFGSGLDKNTPRTLKGYMQKSEAETLAVARDKLFKDLQKSTEAVKKAIKAAMIAVYKEGSNQSLTKFINEARLEKFEYKTADGTIKTGYRELPGALDPEILVDKVMLKFLKMATENPDNPIFSSEEIQQQLSALRELSSEWDKFYSEQKENVRELNSLYSENRLDYNTIKEKLLSPLMEDRQEWASRTRENLFDRILQQTKKINPVQYENILQNLMYSFGQAVTDGIAYYNEQVELTTRTGTVTEEDEKRFAEMREYIAKNQTMYDKYLSAFLDARAATQNAKKQFYGSFNLRALKAQVSGRSNPDEKTAKYTENTAKLCQSIYDILGRMWLASSGGNGGGMYYGY